MIHLEECPRRKSLSDMASISQICIPAARGTFQEAQEMRTCLINMKEMERAQKYLRKSCYHRIKFTVTTFLAAFIWRRHLNSETLVSPYHLRRESGVLTFLKDKFKWLFDLHVRECGFTRPINVTDVSQFTRRYWLLQAALYSLYPMVNCQFDGWHFT